jgi:hypothetical protein
MSGLVLEQNLDDDAFGRREQKMGQSAGGYVVYRCRRCAAYFRPIYTSHAVDMLYATIDDMPQDIHVGGRIGKTEVHRCGKGEYGVADIVGVEVRPPEEPKFEGQGPHHITEAEANALNRVSEGEVMGAIDDLARETMANCIHDWVDVYSQGGRFKVCRKCGMWKRG